MHVITAPNEITNWLTERPEIRSIFACICDLNGTLRGKRVPVECKTQELNKFARHVTDFEYHSYLEVE